MYKIFDDLLPKSYLRNLQEHFLSQRCDWYFNDKLTGDESDGNLGSFGFVIQLHWDGHFIGTPSSNIIRGLVFSAQDKVEQVTELPYEVIRARADMTLYNPTNYVHEVHTDYTEEHMTCIFYLNTSDGNTLLYDREGEQLIAEVEPVANRLLVFDGLLKHTGHSPSKHKCRALINMNFMEPHLVHELYNQNCNYGT